MSKFRLEYRYERDPRRIVEAALRTIGIENAAICPQDALDDISAGDWFSLCSFLLISPDCYSYGYSRHEHKARIRTAWEQGELWLPRTPGLKTLLREINEDQRRDRLWQDQHYGLRLRWKVRWQDFKASTRLLPHRLKNEIRVRRYYARTKDILRLVQKIEALHLQGEPA